MIIYIQTVGMLMGRRRVYGQEQTPRGDGAAHSHHGLQAFWRKGMRRHHSRILSGKPACPKGRSITTSPQKRRFLKRSATRLARK